MPSGSDATFRVLMVCTANIARSPLAEVVFDAHMRLRGLIGRVVVDSAGIHAQPDRPAARESIALAAQAGLDLGAHRSRHVDDVEVAGADLVLTMSEPQRDHLGLRHHGLGPRVFTLREAARLMAEVADDALPHPGPARLHAAVAAAHRERPWQLPPPDGDDIADPFGRGEDEYLSMARRVADSLEIISRVALGPR